MKAFVYSLLRKKIVFSMVGFALLLSVIFFNLTAPNPLFSVLMISGLALIFFSLFLYSIELLMDLYDAYNKKDYWNMAMLIIIGILILRIIFK